MREPSIALSGGEAIRYEFRDSRHGWLQVLRGTVRRNDNNRQAADKAAL